VTVGSGRIIYYGDCTAWNLVNTLKVGSYITWNGVNIGTYVHAHGIVCN
jgi:hypothetical protein